MIKRKSGRNKMRMSCVRNGENLKMQVVVAAVKAWTLAYNIRDTKKIIPADINLEE